MRRIRKGREPKGWAEYRLSTPGVKFDDAPKGDLRRALLTEQGYICCYCMRRIDESTTRVEHRIPREKDLSRQFEYRNLLAACQGSEGSPTGEHCDVNKHSNEISVDPADTSRDVETLIHYKASGAVGSRDEQIQHDVDITLNLNLEWMRDARLAVLDGFCAAFDKKHPGDWPTNVMERELKKWSDIPPGGKLMPYSGIVVSYLRRRLRRAGSR